jgi:plasmid stabilization system protein ParE
MSNQIILSPLAEQDLMAIMEYTMSTWGDSQADIYAERLDNALQGIKDNPEIGRLREQIYLINTAVYLSKSI